MARWRPSAVARPLDPAAPWGGWALHLSPDAVDVLRGLARDAEDQAPGIVAAAFAAGLVGLGFAALPDPDPAAPPFAPDDGCPLCGRDPPR